MLFGYPFFEGTNASEILRMNRKFTNEFESITILKNERKNPNSKINKDGLDLCLQLVETDQRKRIRCSDCLNSPFFAGLKPDGLDSPLLKISDPGAGSPKSPHTRNFSEDIIKGFQRKDSIEKNI
mmetsp:Transcript_1097/g.979  ORF Transcript_1097/g.979 Transcript_1097/m.979 type:complete len:125 (+) Transcript_1097:1093-1467(+)